MAEKIPGIAERRADRTFGRNQCLAGKNDNAWLTAGGQHGWEEVPYWLKGYGNLAYILNDPKMIAETKVWLEGVFKVYNRTGISDR